MGQPPVFVINTKSPSSKLFQTVAFISQESEEEERSDSDWNQN